MDDKTKQFNVTGFNYVHKPHPFSLLSKFEAKKADDWVMANATFTPAYDDLATISDAMSNGTMEKWTKDNKHLQHPMKWVVDENGRRTKIVREEDGEE